VADLNPPTDENAALLGSDVILAKADITDEAAVTVALEAAREAHGGLRGLVHCAGRGGDRTRIVDRAGKPGSLDTFADVIRVNLIGTYNVLRLAAAQISQCEPLEGERGAIVMTASVAAFDGQIGQTSYSAAKAAVHGITLVAARDLASRLIRVNTIAPGVFDTPMLGRLREDIRSGLEGAVPHPSRLGSPDDYARLAVSILENPYLNGETIRLDGAIRMAPR
jgi:NAD(P)-dependent dehydrogenase (short-subunit alcohol dehydrogenase family)